MLIKGFMLIITFISVFSYANDYNKIEQYLNSIKSFEANFTQTSDNGAVSLGRFLLSKPGKIRWEYLAPKHLLILGRNKKIVYCDYELEEVSYASSKSVLAHFLTKEHLILGVDVKVEKFTQKQDSIELAVSDDNSSKETNISRVILKFENNPIKLVQINMTDFNGLESEIIFKDIKINRLIDKSEFIFKNPKFFTSLK